MTRQVPKYQADSDRFDMGVVSVVERTGSKVLGLLPGGKAQDGNSVVMADTEQPGASGAAVQSAPPLPVENSGAYTAWRRGLLNQYMYLLSAPFLAIVTYYLLWWLQLTKKPVLVLVSFSVGLISEAIVTKIIDVVNDILKTKTTTSTTTTTTTSNGSSQNNQNPAGEQS